MTATVVRSNLEQLERWKKLYHDQLKLKTNFKTLQQHWRRQEDLLGLAISEGNGFGQLTKLIVTPQGVDDNRLYEACAKRFPCWRCVDDFNVIRSDHAAISRDLACWIEPSPEAPAEFQNRSANDLTEAGVSTLVLGGRLAYELDYYEETDGQHLDRETVTLIHGSRFPDGLVLRADWSDGGFGVDWWDPRDAHSRLRGRVAVYV